MSEDSGLGQVNELISENRTQSALEQLDKILGSCENSDTFYKAHEIYETLGHFAQARQALIKAVDCSKDSAQITKSSEKLKHYQELLKGKEEFEEFNRLNKSSELHEGSLFHLISKTWLRKWEEYLLWENQHPGPISNSDIIDSKDFIQDQRPGKSYSNILLKPECKEGIDFVLASKPAYSFLLKKYGSDNNIFKRWCISLNDDGSGLHVELRQKALQVRIIPDSSDKKCTFYMSRIETLMNLKEKICAFRKDLGDLEFRAWKAGINVTLPEAFTEKKHTFDGKILNESCIIEDCEIAESDMIVAEFKYLTEWVLYRSGDICCYCKNSGDLKFCLGCKVVKYCSKKCQQDDFRQHKDFCHKVKQSSNTKSGLVGLNNLSNTCFMNSALQCVLHIKDLKSYFLSQTYKSHINTNNPLGTKDAALAKVFAEMMENVWLGNENVISPWSFKKIISKFAPQFTGYEQHDSHELLMYLLTGLHEDLNQITKKPYVEKPDCDNISDEKASKDNWDWFLTRNKSIFVDFMYGQLKSTLKCPDCGRNSITFDPFLTFGVNIPNANKKSCTVLIVMLDNTLIKQEITLMSNTKIVRIKSLIAENHKLKNLVLCYYNKLSIQGVCEDYADVYDYKEKLLIAYELKCKTKGMYPIPLRFVLDIESRYIISFTRLMFFHQQKTFAKIHSTLKKRLPGEFKVNIVNTAGYSGIFNKSRLPCDFCGSTECQNCPLPKTHRTLFNALESMKNNEGQFMLEIAFSPDNEFANMCNSLVDSTPISEDLSFGDHFTLFNCLDYSLRSETLDIDNEWYCSGCKKHVQALKSLELYILPKVLIFHLIRFKSRGVFSQKNTEFVEFPVKGMCLEGYTATKNNGVYDLFAVSNHYGNLGGGHFTACIEVEGVWYCMDDSSVTQISEDKVVSSAAYILFYHLRE